MRVAVLSTLLVVGCGGRTTGVHTTFELADASTEGDGGACTTILASSYDQSCQSDSDCVQVATGNLCPDACASACTGGMAINRSSVAAYEADLDRAGFPSQPASCPPCSLPPPFGPCCRGGACMNGPSCQTYPQPPVDAGACPASEMLCPVGCSGALECLAPPCPPIPPCQSVLPAGDAGTGDDGGEDDADACPAGEKLCPVGCSGTLECVGAPCPPIPPCAVPDPCALDQPEAGTPCKAGGACMAGFLRCVCAALEDASTGTWLCTPPMQ